MSRPRLKCLKPRLAPPSRPSGWQPDSIRGNRHQRGYGAEWERLRETILDRDTGLCQPCYKRGQITIGTQVDHEIPKAHGGTDHPSNLQTICDACHKAKTARESNRGGG
jgi:5-methylcytosine-specific restriction protein A